MMHTLQGKVALKSACSIVAVKKTWMRSIRLDHQWIIILSLVDLDQIIDQWTSSSSSPKRCTIRRQRCRISTQINRKMYIPPMTATSLRN